VNPKLVIDGRGKTGAEDLRTSEGFKDICIPPLMGTGCYTRSSQEWIQCHARAVAIELRISTGKHRRGARAANIENLKIRATQERSAVVHSQSTGYDKPLNLN